MKDMTNPDPNLRPEPLIDDVDRALRPQNLNDFTGQSEARANLKVFIESAKKKRSSYGSYIVLWSPWLR